MNDDPLLELREEPRPEFAASLARRLQELDEQERAHLEGAHRRVRLMPPLLGAGLAAAAALAFTLPPVRAAAREFLELFRVKRFAAVPVDPERLARLQEGKVDLKTLVGEQVEWIEPAQEPVLVEGPEAAAARTGVTLRQPTVLPDEAALAEVRVGSPGRFRVRLDTAKLESLAAALGVEDVEIPPAWDGATIEVAAAPVVAMRYRRGEDDFVFFQSRSPEVQLPQGLELAQLGALALRMAGMSAEEARVFARTIDWRSTLLVPIPAEGGTFREVDVNGAKGLLATSIQKAKPGLDGKGGRSRRHSVLLWSAGGKVFAVAGPGDGVLVLEMAQSVR
jgi:hypothetical protein